MNRKVFGIFLCTLFIFNVLATVNVVSYDNHDVKNKTTQFSGDIIVVGIMDRVNVTEEYKDYEVHVAVILDESIDIFIDKEEILRIYNPHGLEYGSIVVIFCDDWVFL